MDRIERIKAFSNKVENEKIQKAIKEKAERDSLVQKIMQTRGTCKELIKLAETCVNNKVPLGEQGTHGPKYKTEGIRHLFGFYVFKNEVLGLGYAGGGWNGDDFIVNKDGMIISGAKHPRFKQLAKDFIKDIEPFKNDFYSYIDTLEV